MDKWDDLTQRVQNAILAEEPEAAMSAAFQTVAEFGRTLEQIGADLDRIATAIEGSILVDHGPALPPAMLESRDIGDPNFDL